MSPALPTGQDGVGNEAGFGLVSIALTALAALFAACSSVPVSPLEDGASTVRGPAVILTGDFPDPTVVRDGSTYYMTHSSFDRLEWVQHPRGLEVSGFQTNNLGGFSSLKLGVYAKGSGPVRVEDFQYRAIE
ncbi:MAG: hypothetical protein OXN96_06955 [Bryobacterales bacterium]|nr:hypothetical protein [Bryobacterales bacterium]